MKCALLCRQSTNVTPIPPACCRPTQAYREHNHNHLHIFLVLICACIPDLDRCAVPRGLRTTCHKCNLHAWGEEAARAGMRTNQALAAPECGQVSEWRAAPTATSLLVIGLIRSGATA